MNDPETTEEVIQDILIAAGQATVAIEEEEDPPEPRRLRREDLDWGSAI